MAMLTPWVAAAALGLLARRVGRLAPPASVVRLLVLAALSAGFGCGFVLAVIAFTLAAQNPWLARLGGWGPAEIRLLDPVSPPVGVAAGLAVSVLLLIALRRAAHTARGLWVAGMACRRLGPGVDGMVVIDDPYPDAYALPGWTGRTVVSTGMLRALDGPQRRVLLAHEASHLSHRHHLYVLLADVAAAANPLLLPVAAAVRHGVERWADEDAATAVADRALAARAIAGAALAQAHHGSGQPRPATALAVTHGGVVDRAEALLAPAPRPRRLITAALAALVLSTTASMIVVDQTTQHRFEQAQATSLHTTAAACATSQVTSGLR